MTQRFFLDGRKLGDGGIGTFIETFVSGLILANESGLENYVLDLVVGRDFVRQNKIPKEWEDHKELNIYEDNTSKYSCNEYFIFPLKWRDLIKKSSVYISPHYTLPFFIPIKKIVVIHDLIQIQYPEKIAHRILPRRLIESAIHRADCVATVSQHSRKCILNFYSDKKFKIEIIPNSTKQIYKREKKTLNLNCPTFIFVGADRSHKQLLVYLEFLRLFKESGRSFKGLLISEISSSSRSLIEEYELADSLSIYNNVSNEELANLYNLSDALICTAIEEGFGLPLLEAMAMGLIVLCPDLEYARELVGDAGVYYEYGSASDIFYSWIKLEKGIFDYNECINRGLLIACKYTPINQFKAFLECV